jgi:hypothetical protein
MNTEEKKQWTIALEQLTNKWYKKLYYDSERKSWQIKNVESRCSNCSICELSERLNQDPYKSKCTVCPIVLSGATTNTEWSFPCLDIIWRADNKRDTKPIYRALKHMKNWIDAQVPSEDRMSNEEKEKWYKALDNTYNRWHKTLYYNKNFGSWERIDREQRCEGCPLCAVCKNCNECIINKAYGGGMQQCLSILSHADIQRDTKVIFRAIDKMRKWLDKQ